jgi:hypothetical protein
LGNFGKLWDNFPKRVHDEYKGTRAAVSALLWSLFFLLFQLFRNSDQDLDGQQRNITTAANNTNFPCATPNTGIYQKAVIIFDVQSRLSLQVQNYFLHYSTIIIIFLTIILIISKVEAVILVSIHCRNEPLWQERKQHIITPHRRPRSMCPVPWRMRLMQAQQHGRSGFVSANQRTWLEEICLSKLQHWSTRTSTNAFLE